jgi:hypothetical protein
MKFDALFGNFHFKFTFHIIRVGRKAKPHIWHKINDLYLKMSTSLTLFTPVVLSKNNKILIIINLAFHSFFSLKCNFIVIGN